MKNKSIIAVCCVLIVLTACPSLTAKAGGYPVKLITLDPGHFHAALVQKSMYDQVDPVVHVYAPDGADVRDHLGRIYGFNQRQDNPTNWRIRMYTGPNFLDTMLKEKPGNVLVLSGNNSRKTDYILAAVKAGLNILADKPMVISPDKFPMLQEAFEVARDKDLLLYDVMTERYEITTLLQKELSLIPSVFGTLQQGTPDNPAVTKESVHHFFKYVSGNPIKRPGWFFDETQRGEALVDVSTHLVDLIQWECFPEQIIDYKRDIEIVSARRLTTLMTADQFKKVTQTQPYPAYLQKHVTHDQSLKVFSGGEMIYRIKGVVAKVSIAWNYQAPEGTGDTHYSVMRGTKCNLIIRQGQAEAYKPTLYIEALGSQDIKHDVVKAVGTTLQAKYPGLRVKAVKPGCWVMTVPDRFKIGHEAHFAQVTKKYLGFLGQGSLPAWEVPNMIAKYYTTTQALRMAME